MSAPTKTATDLLGTAAGPATVAHGGTPVNSTAFDLRTDFGAVLGWQVSFPASAPTVAPTLQPQVSPDGTHWLSDGGAFAPTPVNSTTVSGTYVAPVDALYVRIVVINADSAADITSWITAMATTGVA
jgi:hypothetical protein